MSNVFMVGKGVLFTPLLDTNAGSPECPWYCDGISRDIGLAVRRRVLLPDEACAGRGSIFDQLHYRRLAGYARWRTAIKTGGETRAAKYAYALRIGAWPPKNGHEAVFSMRWRVGACVGGLWADYLTCRRFPAGKPETVYFEIAKGGDSKPSRNLAGTGDYRHPPFGFTCGLSEMFRPDNEIWGIRNAGGNRHQRRYLALFPRANPAPFASPFLEGWTFPANGRRAEKQAGASTSSLTGDHPVKS